MFAEGDMGQSKVFSFCSISFQSAAPLSEIIFF